MRISGIASPFYIPRYERRFVKVWRLSPPIYDSDPVLNKTILRDRLGFSALKAFLPSGEPLQERKAALLTIRLLFAYYQHRGPRARHHDLIY
jgi:hypothetical protein